MGAGSTGWALPGGLGYWDVIGKEMQKRTFRNWAERIKDHLACPRPGVPEPQLSRIAGWRRRSSGPRGLSIYIPWCEIAS